MEPVKLILYIYSFFIGIVVASFINVVIYRVPLGLSVAKGRSYCPNCNHKLSWYDLFPIFSYLFLGGKCRYCKANIPMRDTVIEFVGGLIGILCFHHYQFTLDTLVVFIVIMILLAITMIDFDTMTIPNGLVIALIVPTIVMMVLHPEITLLERVIGFFCISFPMYLLILAIPDCFGGGDVKLIAAGGFLLGWKLTLVAGFIAILIGGFYAVWLLVSKKSKKGAHIAFGPYLSIGIVISLLYGNSLLNAYLALFQM